MSDEIRSRLAPLRDAARLMRERAEQPWHSAVADWLDIGANPYACVNLDPMLAVANAYLSDASGICCACSTTTKARCALCTEPYCDLHLFATTRNGYVCAADYDDIGDLA